MNNPRTALQQNLNVWLRRSGESVPSMVRAVSDIIAYVGKDMRAVLCFTGMVHTKRYLSHLDTDVRRTVGCIIGELAYGMAYAQQPPTEGHLLQLLSRYNVPTDQVETYLELSVYMRDTAIAWCAKRSQEKYRASLAR